MIDKTGGSPVTGNTIVLNSGEHFDIAKPENTVFKMEDIAAGLANTCRFSGQLDRFYSVAEHSVHCLRLARAMGCSIDETKAVFMHDAAEAFVGDVASPLKAMLPTYRAIEKRIESSIFNQFGLSHHSIVKTIDLILLRAEKEEFIGKQGDWKCLDGVTEPLKPIYFNCWSPGFARQWFLEEAHALCLWSKP